MRIKKEMMVLLALAALALGGCGPSQEELLATEQADATRVYATAEAILTEAAADFTATPTASMTPTATTTPTVSPTPGIAGTNTSQPLVTPCNLASFVDDVTIPDGTEFEPGEDFTKTWKLKNEGTCTWDSTYKLVFVSGNKMEGPSTQQLTTDTIAPGQTIDISVELTSPAEADTYYGYWGLQSGSGENFGIDRAGSSFYVQIEVPGDGVATATTAPEDTPVPTTAPTTEPEATETTP